MNTLETTLSSRRFNTIMLLIGAAVLVIGVIVFISRFAGSDGTSAAPSQGFQPTIQPKTTPLKNAQGVTVKRYEQLDPSVKSTIRTFVTTAVARKNLDKSWAVIHPSMKAGYTFKSWTHAKALPVIPYPVGDVDNATRHLYLASAEEILVDMGLSPKPGSDQRSTRFRMGLVPVGKGAHKRWLVNYWMPLWTPLVPKN